MHADYRSMDRASRCRRWGFTLVELLVVIVILGVLMAILIPVVGKIRGKAQVTQTAAFIQQLSRAIESYYGDFKAYPGPFSNLEVTNSQAFPGGTLMPGIDPGASAAGFDTSQPNAQFRQRITMAENLVLGLLGGLRVETNPIRLWYDPRLVGSGPTSLSYSGAANARHKPYADVANPSWRTENGLKTGLFKDDAGSANDTIIPEFVDTFADPMPILYLRARVGASSTTNPPTMTDNAVITYNAGQPNNRIGQYDLHQVIGYTDSAIGVGRKLTDHGLRPPIRPEQAPDATDPVIDPYYYFRNSALSQPSKIDTSNVANPRMDVPHQKDAYILISAGLDRVYGTSDDITNFGGVQ